MAAQTGRTVSRFTNFTMTDSGEVMRDIPINSLSVCGVVYEEQDLTAFQDAVKGALPGMPSAPIEISGPFDTTAVVPCSTTGNQPALSGSHTVLSGVHANALYTPRTVDVRFGIRHWWTATEPQFGISGDTSPIGGYLLTSYTVNADDMTYSARFELYPGSILPAWGTAIET